MSYGAGSSTWSAPQKLHGNLDLASLRPALEGVNRDVEAPVRLGQGRAGGGDLLVLVHCSTLARHLFLIHQFRSVDLWSLRFQTDS